MQSKTKKYSFENYKLSKNLKDAIWESTQIFIPAIVAEVTLHNPTYTVLAGIIGRVVTGAIEFWLSD